MPSIVSPGGAPAKVANVRMGPIDLAPGVRYVYENIDDNLFGDVFSFNFATGVKTLSSVQLKVLQEDVVPLLTASGAVAEFYGLADRSGSQQINYNVSHDRLANFQFAARSAGAPPQLVFGPQHKYFGEDFAAEKLEDDDSSDFFMRCVIAVIWPNFQSSQRILQDLSIVEYGRSHDQP